MTIAPAHRKAVVSETLISIAINALVPAAIIWLVDVTPPAALGHETGLVQGLLKGSGLATLLMTLVITLIVRARVRRGTVPPLALAAVPGFARWLSSNILARAVVMGLVAALILVPFWSGIASALGLLPMTKTGFGLFNLIFGTTVGLTMTAAVVLRALADQ